MSWFTRLFARKPKGLLGQRVHAWTYGPYGRGYVEGEVVAETERSLTIDPSVPSRQEFRAFVLVWRHDARPMGERLPVEVLLRTEGVTLR